MNAEDAVPAGFVVQPFGDRAVLVDLRRAPGAETSRLVHDLAAALANPTPLAGGTAPREAGTGFEPPVPAASTILIPVDPVEPGVAVAAERVRAVVAAWRPAASASTPRSETIVEIPVRYGGEDGPDLETVSQLTGLSPADVVALHTGHEYEVAFLGFAPGFAYLGPLPPALTLPRRPEPRSRVPAGAVAIGGPQTAVYSGEGPGGWWLLGRTATIVWDPLRDPPALLRPGTHVRFRPIA